jgi:cytochrome c
MAKLLLIAGLCASLLAASATASASEALAKSKGCLNCHAIDSKRVGPAYKDVAQKYAGQADASAKLAAKVIQGGGGAWGGMAMPPNPQVSPDEAKQLVQWILSLK